MTRRDLIRLTGSSILYTGLAPLLRTRPADAAAPRRLFFELEDLPRIRTNARSPKLRAMYEEWADKPISFLSEALDAFEATGDMIGDFQTAVWWLSRSAMVQLVEPSEARESAIINAVERIIEFPKWDYFRDGESEVLGIQRAPFTAVRVLLAREILGSSISENLERRLLDAVAEKGCLACYNTVYDMDNPDTVKGWDFDERHADYYAITMARWPMILGANNLRAAPTGALGLGALALQGYDPRADEWLATAVASTRRFLTLFEADGSYFEGISYLSYSLRTLLPFIRAHSNLIGDVDWTSLVNFDGILEYIVSMQLGETANGDPDVVNFSDSRLSVFAGGISLIGAYTGNPLAGYASTEMGMPRWSYDLLWYRPDAPSEPPKRSLLNVRNDLDWIICRSGWEADDSVVAFKSGAPANHEHADRNHITYKAFGERLLNDHFGAAYDRRHPGWKMRLTEAHNAVLVDGRGHPYIDGLEGTNDSQAFATITQYEDHGDRVWWTSDASAAYILDNYHAHQVLRTVLFAKPGILVVVDQVRLRYRPQTVDIRFFPDNSDGQATLTIDGNRFVIARPNARLHGLVHSDTQAVPRQSRLDVPTEVGDFPCVEVHSPEALSHHIVTVLMTTKGSNIESPNVESPNIRVTRKGSGWSVSAGGFRATVTMTAHAPRIRLL